MFVEDLAQIVAPHIVHDQVLAAGRFDKVVSHPRQVGVRQPRQDHRFILKLLLGFSRGVAVLFKRNEPIREISIGGKIDGPHTTLVEALFNSIAPLL